MHILLVIARVQHFIVKLPASLNLQDATQVIECLQTRCEEHNVKTITHFPFLAGTILAFGSTTQSATKLITTMSIIYVLHHI